MTTTAQTTDEKKAHDGGMSFFDVLTNSKPATRQALADDALLLKADGLLEPERLLAITRPITIPNGEDKGNIVQTQGSIALALTDKHDEMIGAAFYQPNSNQLPTVITYADHAAIIIGENDPSSDVIAFDDLDYALEYYSHTAHLKQTIIVSPLKRNRHQFKAAIEHWGNERRVIVPMTLDDHKTKKLLAGVNAQAWITVADIVTMLDGGNTFDDIQNEADIVELQATGWADPEPLANDPSKPTDYPIHAFNGLLRRVIEWVAYYAQVPLAMAGQCVLAALAHMGQRFIDAPFGRGFMPASLILITEGASGSGKTQAMNLTHFKIEQHERQEYEQYLEDLDVWELDKGALKGAELREYLSTTPKPINPKAVFDDATIEPILDKFVNGEIINASWSTDEAGQFFNGHTMKGDTAGNALSAITKLHSSGRASRQRSQKSAYATPRTDAYDVRLTLFLQGQRIILEPALTDPLMNEQGFLARALIACPPDMRGQRVWNDAKRRRDDPNDNPDLIEYWGRCESLFKTAPANEPTTAQGQPERIKMRWADDDTEQAFYEQMQAIENRQASGQVLEYFKAYASRMAENASRIAALIAFFEGRRVINKDDITRAFLLVEYSTSERLRYLDATPTGEQNDSEKLSAWLVSKAKGKKPHKLGRTYIANNAPNPLRKSSKLLQIELDKLESANHVKQEMDGRSKVVFINPKLFI
ncbi:DUF3987 domain-containing protein [Psychrobacter ciconiae]|uniref:DUF3987 domain-containing protein n=1 Tax=Psychrobacter ciconiae TaxID=1553449 RepID=UPI00191AC79B|nr:DUF3987 domain-containing protein [Psychrobacter ciconiae]